MKTFYGLLLTAFLLLVAIMGSQQLTEVSPQAHISPKELLANKLVPSEHFFLQKSYPDPTFDIRGYEQAMTIARRQKQPSTRSSNEWVVQGPGNIGGRINTVAIHPTNNDIIYVGSTAGGVHKTTDGGLTWLPIFDDFAYLAIGAITLDPSDPEIVYVGTGDPNITGYPFIGDGVYKSMNGGQTWMHIGLQDQRIVSRIIVDPTDSLTIFVATMGLPFERNNDRGLYKSTDGGLSWSEVLFVSNQAGIIDLVMDPFNPDVLYAASWDRVRNNQESIIYGPGAVIWKSTDNGDSWTLLSTGLPPTPQGRIGLTISQQTPGLLYALYVDVNSAMEGVYKTTNAGNSWTDVSGDVNPNILGGFGWYFGQIRVSPTNDDEIWALGVNLHRSQNSGTNWFQVGPSWNTYQVHADKHDLQFTANGDIYLTTDGGLYKSTDNGATWADIENIPNTQFYRVGVNPHQPTTYYGGAQDNGSTSGNLANINSWSRIYGGDGFQMRFDPVNANLFYAETQRGNLVYTNNGGNSFQSHSNNINNSDRRNWDMPFILSVHDRNRHYTGTYRVYRTIFGAGSNWAPISPDLTDGNIFGSSFHTISTVHESPVDGDVLYAGTTDGNVWVSTDFGANWIDVTDSLPNRYVSSVKASPTDSATAFVSHSGYKYNDFFPHIHKTTDHGATWTDISGDLPPLAINDVYLYPTDEDIIFVATDGGVYATLDGGNDWERLGNNMPMIPVYDLEIEPTTNILIAGTHARSIMTYELDQFLPPAQPVISSSSAVVFCEGDSVILSAPTGFAAYLWTNGDTTQSITVDTSGTFQVSVTNAVGITSPLSDSVIVEVQAYPDQPVISPNGILCEGEGIDLNGPGGYASYLWNGMSGDSSFAITDSGFYTLQVATSAGCLSPVSDSLFVEVLPIPVADFSVSGSWPTYTFDNLAFQSGTSYFWDFGDGATSTDASPTHTFLLAGEALITLIAANPCGVDTLSLLMSVTDLEERVKPSVRISPNPASRAVQIEIEGVCQQEVVLQLFDIQGRKVKEQIETSAGDRRNLSLPLSDLKSGIYLLAIKNCDTDMFRRIVVQR